MLMTKGMPFCSATCAIAVLCPESKAPTRSCAPSRDQLLGARTRHVDVGLGVGVHDLKLGQAQFLEDRRRDVDAALAVLADAGLRARTRQQDADLQRSALRAHDIERSGACDERGGAGARCERAARHSLSAVNRIVGNLRLMLFLPQLWSRPSAVACPISRILRSKMQWTLRRGPGGFDASCCICGQRWDNC